jgi:hypothetical protein
MKKTLLSILLPVLIVLSIRAQHTVIFQVDLGLAVPSDTVSIAGDFQLAAGFPEDWMPGTTTLADANGDSIYELTAILPADTFQYKFVNGTTWGDAEGVPSACAISGNRQVIVTGDMTIPLICFGMCDPCPTNIDSANVTFRVDMTNETVGDTVSIAGDFQMAAGFSGDWSPGSTVLDDLNSDNIYELTVRLPEGTYQFKFINGVDWGFDEPVPSGCAVSNNRELVVAGTDDIVLDVVCFGTCVENCPVLLPPVEVTFHIDMIDEIVNVDGIFVSGSFQTPAWIKDTLLMSDPESDGVYTFTASIVPGEYQFKFFNGDGGDPEGETADFVTLGCGVDNGIGGANRLLNITGLTTDTVLYEYIYNACEERMVGINDMENDELFFTISPNPFRDFMTIHFSTLKNDVRSIRIFDVIGKEVFRKEDVFEKSMRISVEPFSSGVYFVQVFDDRGANFTKKIIAE